MRTRRLGVAALVIGVLVAAHAAMIVVAGQTAFRFPASLTNAEFKRLVWDLSERGGSFHTDNFVSNETAVSDVALALQERGRGGVYMGVGPEQNFSYIVALQPEAAFIVDIRRQNLLEHLMYKAIAELSADRATFLFRLFSRARAPGAAPTDLKGLLNAVRQSTTSRELFERNLADVLDCLKTRHALPLSDGDETTIRLVYDRFRGIGPDITYAGGGPWPTFAMVVSGVDRNGVGRTFLSTDENYRTFKRYQERNLIVPIVGDFAGPQAVRKVGEYIQSRGSTVKAFYLSNVEQYLFQSGVAGKFYENAFALPLDERSVFIRSIPQGGRSTNGLLGSARLSIAPALEFLGAVAQGRIRSFTDIANYRPR